MTELMKNALSPESLDPRRYLQSLTAQAAARGLFSEADFRALQSALYDLLARQTDRLNGGKSSSIRIEQAQELFASLLFVLSLRLKACENPDDALEELKHRSVQALFDEGLERIRRRLGVCRLIQQRILSRLFETPNRFYRLTIADGIDGFFKLYRPPFAAQEIHITADYPPLAGRPKLDGVEFIEQYLRAIEAENAFLCCFDPEDAHRLLRTMSPEYAVAPLNLMEPVLLAALGLALCGRNPWRLDLTGADVGRLSALLGGRSESELCEQLSGALAALKDRLPGHVYAYARGCLPRLAASVRASAQIGQIDRAFLTPGGEPEEIVRFSYGERMPDSEYRSLLDEVRSAEGETRVQLALQGLRSLADFIDLLADADWREDELSLLVRRLSPADRAALAQLYPDEALLCRESERRLCRALSGPAGCACTHCRAVPGAHC